MLLYVFEIVLPRNSGDDLAEQAEGEIGVLEGMIGGQDDLGVGKSPDVATMSR